MAECQETDKGLGNGSRSHDEASSTVVKEA